ncbi:YdbC family protein [Streptococcus dysgalactiae]|uniref:YdbC family protein n=1 Tax=Streptococcus dysgalactiae TaxID=1334 RepID=UPI0010CAB825|nr:PC4/YdbC family ssDNA-binding protein [Streptococcus dysgalactiae]VTS15894.1 seryl-tRNA synthetase-like protein [Streptococcus dysgalactiae subsp. equisimilis]
MTDWQNGNGWIENFEDQQEKIQSNRQPKKDNNEPIQYKIIEHIATLSISETGWKKELNIISWNNAEPKFDIRSWKDGYSRVGKGVTLFEDEMLVLVKTIKHLNLKGNQKEE